MFEYIYRFGAFSPVNGAQFQLEMPCCNADAFQLFLNQFAKQNPDEYKIIVLDNGAFHKAKSLTVPQNITLLFLPPYSPELDPAEKIWQHIKRKFTNKHFNDLNEISFFSFEAIQQLTIEKVKSICVYLSINKSL